uniref:RING-type domain-containing protein n=1 Tax=Xiphophorus couchianus TaxID=32473 RepID=A0A3B5LDL1_9TELE
MLPEKQLQCSICQQVLTDPVTTPCGHNFCRVCIGQLWDSSDVCQCPACSKTTRRKLTLTKEQPNLTERGARLKTVTTFL